MIEFKKTSRGLVRGSFQDFNGEKCSIQESSLATEAAIWLGTDDADPKVLTSERGWVSVGVPEGTQFTTRMHLSQDQVAEMLPTLQYFAETGRLPEK